MTSTPHERAMEAAKAFNEQKSAKTIDEFFSGVCQAYLTALLDDPEVVVEMAKALRFKENGNVSDDIDPVVGYIDDATAALSALKRKAGI